MDTQSLMRNFMLEMSTKEMTNEQIEEYREYAKELVIFMSDNAPDRSSGRKVYPDEGLQMMGASYTSIARELYLEEQESGVPITEVIQRRKGQVEEARLQATNMTNEEILSDLLKNRLGADR